MDAPELYVKRMVVNEFLSWRRRRASQSVPRSDIGGLLPGAPDPTTQRDERDATIRLIATLPPRQRAVIALRFYEDLAMDQIAEILGCRTVTVRTHLMRALAALQTALPAPLVTTTPLMTRREQS